MTDSTRHQTAVTGRDSQGRFIHGNAGGTGNPYAKQVAELRAAMMKAATPENMRKVADTLFEKAISGDVAAIKVLLDRLFGRVPDSLNLSVTPDAPPEPKYDLSKLTTEELKAFRDIARKAAIQ